MIYRSVRRKMARKTGLMLLALSLIMLGGLVAGSSAQTPQVPAKLPPGCAVTRLAATSMQSRLSGQTPQPAYSDPPGSPVTPPTSTNPPAQPAVAKITNGSNLQAWQVLEKGLSSHNAGKRTDAVVALATIAGDDRAERMVEAALNDPNVGVRATAAAKLGEMQARRAVPNLQRALQDPSAEVRFAAANSLSEMGDYSGRAILIDVLTGKQSPSHGFVQSGLDGAKQKMSSPSSLLITGAGAGAGAVFPGAGLGVRLISSMAKDRSGPAKMQSASALGCDPDPQTLRQLEAALNNGNWMIRLTVAKALGDENVPQALPVLEGKLKDSNHAVSCMAAASIVRLSEADASQAAGISNQPNQPAVAAGDKAE